MADPVYNPSYVPTGRNSRDNNYYKTTNHVKLSRDAASRSVFDVLAAYTIDELEPNMVFRPSADFYYSGTQIRKFAEKNDSKATSNRTVIDSDGLLKWVGHNLLTFSEQFDNAAWGKGNTIVTANQALAPNNTLTMDEIVFDATPNANIQSFGTSVVGGVYTFACWVFADTAVGNVKVQLDGGSDQDMAITTTPTLVTFTGTAADTGFNVVIVTRDSVAATIYLWGAHLYRSDLEMQGNDTAFPMYNPTGADAYFAPARDHNPVTLAPVGMRFAPEAANLYIFSNDFTDAAWVYNTSDVIVNVGVSPDGSTNASKFVGTSGSTNIRLRQRNTLTSGVVYTYSKCFKAAEYDDITVSRQDTNIDIFEHTFDMTTGIATGGGVIEDLGNGWFRCSGTVTCNATSLTAIVFKTGDGETGDTTSGILMYGGQLEVGSVATSYIPTGASSVTRTIDTVQMGPVVSEVELWTSSVATGDGWTDNGDGSFSCDGSQAGNANLTTTPTDTLVVGRTYRMSFTVSNYSAGTIRAVAGSAVGDTVAADGPYSADVIATSTNPPQARGNLNFIGDIDDLTVQELVPFVGFDQTKGTFVTVTTARDVSVDNRNFTLSDGTSSNRITSRAQSSLNLYAVDGGGIQANIPAGTYVNDVRSTLVTGWGLNDFGASLDGATTVTDVSGTVPSVTELHYGARYDGAGSLLDGHLELGLYYPVIMTSDQKERLGTQIAGLYS